MKIVGLTGGIASGKSTVTKMFADLGAQTLSADDDARAVLVPNSPLAADIARAFPAAVAADGSVNRSALAALIFAEPSARAQLDAIMHPAIIQRMKAAIEEKQSARMPGVVVYEVPLLFEAGLENLFDDVIAVTASPVNQEQRLQAREYTAGRPLLSADAVADRLTAQLSSEVKASRAQYIIRNDETLEATRAQVLAIWAEINGEQEA